MLDHVSLRVADYDRSKRFYEAALAPLGYVLAMEADSGAGFRKGYIPSFWIKQGDTAQPQGAASPMAGCGGPAVHVAFASEDRQSVDAFYHAALEAGALDNGTRACVPTTTRTITAHSFLDPDGYNIEAVCHRPEP